MEFLQQIPNWLILAAVAVLLVVGNYQAIWDKIKPNAKGGDLAALNRIAARIATTCEGEDRDECLAAYDRLKKHLSEHDAKSV